MKTWPHAPRHHFPEAGAYIVTAGTYLKRHFFDSRERLDALQDELFTKCARYGWELQAWAIFCNHYHFIAHSPEEPGNLPRMVMHLHSDTSRLSNRWDGLQGRRVWFQYWDTHLSYQRSYLARLRYVHENPVRHGLVRDAADYPWFSAAWFAERAERSFQKVVAAFPTDRVNVRDDWSVALPGDW